MPVCGLDHGWEGVCGCGCVVGSSLNKEYRSVRKSVYLCHASTINNENTEDSEKGSVRTRFSTPLYFYTKRCAS